MMDEGLSSLLASKALMNTFCKRPNGPRTEREERGKKSNYSRAQNDLFPRSNGLMIRPVFVELLDLAIEKGDCKSRRMEEKPVFAIRIRIEKKPTD